MKDGPVITYNGNFVLDVNYGVIEDPEGLAARMSMIPGVVEPGYSITWTSCIWRERTGLRSSEEGKAWSDSRGLSPGQNYPKIDLTLMSLTLLISWPFACSTKRENGNSYSPNPAIFEVVPENPSLLKIMHRVPTKIEDPWKADLTDILNK